MNTLEIKRYLHRYNTKNTKIIVCAIDELPRMRLNNNFNYGFVINLSKREHMGSHWVALYIKRSKKRGERRGYFLCSYGFLPKSWYLTDFIKRICRHVTYNTTQLQQLQSSVCGKYAACFIIHMIKGYPFKDFIDKFSKNLLINDHFIEKVYQYYHRNI